MKKIIAIAVILAGVVLFTIGNTIQMYSTISIIEKRLADKEHAVDTVEANVDTSKAKGEQFNCIAYDFVHRITKSTGYPTYGMDKVYLNALYLDGVLRGTISVSTIGIHKSRKPKERKAGSKVEVLARITPTKDCPKWGCADITIKEVHTTIQEESVVYFAESSVDGYDGMLADEFSNTEEYPFNIWDFPYERTTDLNAFYMPLSENELNLIRTKDKKGRNCLKILPSFSTL